MAAYASVDDVLSRAGRFASVFQIDGKHPDEADLEAFLDDTAELLDSSIGAAGFAPATMSSDARASLVDLNAYGALARALAAANLGPQAADLLAEARSMWDLGVAAIAGGTHSVILLLQSGGTGPSAGNLWTDDPTYGSELGLEAEGNQLWDTNLAPGFRRGQHL